VRNILPSSETESLRTKSCEMCKVTDSFFHLLVLLTINLLPFSSSKLHLRDNFSS